MNHSIDYFLIFLSALLTFSRSIHNDFIFDDQEAIVKNKDLQDVDNIFSLKVFQHDFWGTKIADNSSHKSYRPLTVIVYRLIAKFVKNINNQKTIIDDKLSFHFVNLLSYCLCCCYLYFTIKNWLKSSLIYYHEFRQNALKITLFFTLHPLHCEPVSSCVGLADILSGFFSLITLNCFISNINLYNNTNSTKSTTIQKWLFIQSKIVLSTLISMLFKEQGITILGFLIILIIQLWLTNNKNIRKWKFFTIALFYLVTIFGFLYLRLWIMNFTLPHFGPMDNPASHLNSRIYRFINYNYIYLLNTIITICPIWLSFDWSMGCINLIQTFNDFRILLIILFWIIIIISIVKIINLYKKLLQFILFTIITFLPSSNIFFQVGFVIAERNLFLPLLGYCMIFVQLHYYLKKSLSPNFRNILDNCFYLLLIILALRSYKRCCDWNNELKLYELDSQVCPKNAKIYYNIGKISADMGDSIKAIEYYRKSLKLYENYTNAMNNLANILKENSGSELIESKQLLQRACQLEPKFATGWMNLATVEMALGNFDQSELYFFRAIEIRPNHANTHFNMGNLYIKQRKYKEAEKSLLRAIELNKKFTKAWHNLILMKQNQQLYDLAYDLGRKALIELPNDHSLHYLMGNICGQFLKKFSKAEYHFLQAIQLQSNNPSYLNNLAVLYHQNGKYSDAIKYYRKTLTLEPLHQNAKNNLNKLLMNKNKIKH